MAEYRILFTHLTSRETLGELPFTSAQAEWTLNSPGRLTVTCPLTISDITLKLPGQVAPPELSLEEHATGLYLERDGQILWGGIVWNVQADVASDSLTIEAEGWITYFRRRILYWDRSYTSTEQLTIAKELIQLPQAAEFGWGNLNILADDMDAIPSGVLRDRTWYGFERKSFGELLEELAAVDNGFDFGFESYWNGDEIWTKATSTYPATGVLTQYVFDIGVNVSLLSYASDLSSVANSVHGIGSGDGSDKLIVKVSDTSKLGAWPILESIETRSSVKESSTLTAHAQRRLRRGSAPIRHITISVFPDTDPQLGSYKVGDVITLRGSVGYLNVTGQYRITSMSLGINESGAENIQLALAPREIF